MKALKDLQEGDWVALYRGAHDTIKRIARRNERGKIVVTIGAWVTATFHNTGKEIGGSGFIRPATLDEIRAQELAEKIVKLRAISETEWLAMGEKRLRQILTLAGV